MNIDPNVSKGLVTTRSCSGPRYCSPHALSIGAEGTRVSSDLARIDRSKGREMIAPGPTALGSTRRERASLLSCVGEPLKRSVGRPIYC